MAYGDYTPIKNPTIMSGGTNNASGPHRGSYTIGTEARDAYKQDIANVGSRRVPTMSGVDVGIAKQYGGASIAQQPQGEFRQGQMGLAQALQGRIAGTGGPSVAEIQQQRGVEAGIKAAASSAASQPGMSPGQAALMASREREGLINNAVGQASMLRAQEQATAEGQLGQVLQGARGADIGLATSQAGLTQAAGLAGADAANRFKLEQAQLDQTKNIANLDASMKHQKQSDDMTQFYISQGFTQDQAQQKAWEEMERVKAADRSTQASYDLGLKGIESGDFKASDLIGPGIQAGGTLLASAVSDETAKHKEDRSRTSSEINDFLDKLDNASYEYKDEKHGKGRKWGIMAQSAANSDVGKSFVARDKEDGILKLDSNMALSAVLASVKDIHERTKSLEGAA